MRLRNWVLHPLNRRGDTIVEVLLAVGIISFTLITAYGTSTRSTHSIRDGQERQEALALAQSQIELIRLNRGINTDTKGCFDESQVASEHGSDSCKFRTDGTSGCTDHDAYCYVVDTSKDSSGTYEVKVTWDSLSTAQSVISLWYRPPFGVVSAAAGGGGGSPGGNAAIGSDIMPCAPLCTYAPPVGGHYQYSQRLKNLSLNDPANVRSCKWDWGDGNVDSYAGTDAFCLYGSYSEDHQYAPPANLPPYPAACYLEPNAETYRSIYTVTLTVDLYLGGQRTDTHTFGLPDCV